MAVFDLGEHTGGEASQFGKLGDGHIMLAAQLTDFAPDAHFKPIGPLVTLRRRCKFGDFATALLFKHIPTFAYGNIPSLHTT